MISLAVLNRKLDSHRRKETIPFPINDNPKVSKDVEIIDRVG
jgi:hypothetical protein